MNMMLAILFGSIGMGYMIYGKKQQHAVALIAGLALMLFPYFVSNFFPVVIVGLVLMGLPFLFRE